MQLPTNVRVASWLASECLRYFIEQQNLNDDRLTRFCSHISQLVFANDVPNWDNEAMKLEIDGMGDPLPVELENIDGLFELVISVREISASQIYGAFQPDAVINFLKKAIEISNLNLDKYNIEPMIQVSTKPEGWGVPLTHDTVQSFKNENT